MIQAALWLADAAHQVEVRQSMDSVHRVMPDLVMVNQIVERIRPLWYADCLSVLITCLNMPIDRFVFLDSDTYACEPFGDLFGALDRFDLVGAHAPARQTAPLPLPVPDAFCELNVGVLVFRNEPIIRALFQTWLDMLMQHYDVIGDNDQAALRMALWTMPEVKVWVMPPEYNCRFGFGGFAAMPVKIMHNRGYSFERAAQYLNKDRGMRAWRGSDLP